jgi:uncharacterized protein
VSRIYWDTMLFVYWFEDHPKYAERVGQIFDGMRKRHDTLCTSVFTVGELLTGPYKRGAVEIAAQMRDVMRPPTVELLPFSADTAEKYAQIRAQNHVAPADAIHLASASQACVNLFLTNDMRLRCFTVPGVDFIAGLDVNLF